MRNGGSFLSRVNQTLSDLPQAEQRVGTLLRDFPGDLASYSLGELAALARVSKATVSRFIRRLGYESYEDARRQVRDERETGSRLYLASSAATGQGSSIEGHAEVSIENIRRTLSGLDETELDEIVAALLDSRKVWVIGFRASHPIASYLRWQLLQVIADIGILPGPGETMGEHLADIRARDLVVMIGLRRRPSLLSDLLPEIAGRGARLLYITDENAPAQPGVRWHLRCATATPGPLFNHVAVMALCHLLVDMAIERAGQSGRDRLRDIEQANTALNEL